MLSWLIFTVLTKRADGCAAESVSLASISQFGQAQAASRMQQEGFETFKCAWQAPSSYEVACGKGGPLDAKRADGAAAGSAPNAHLSVNESDCLRVLGCAGSKLEYLCSLCRPCSMLRMCVPARVVSKTIFVHGSSHFCSSCEFYIKRKLVIVHRVRVRSCSSVCASCSPNTCTVWHGCRRRRCRHSKYV